MTRKVGVSEQKAVIKLTDAYKRFCQQRRQLTAMELQIQHQLNAYEKALIHETQKPLGLMPRRPRLSVKNRPPLPTGRAKPK